MYAGTIFEFIDQSQIQELDISSTVVTPLYMCAFTSDKGPEAYTVCKGQEFFDLYGNDISFSRHGQPLLQAAMAINSGGRVLAKRVVAEDSELANLAIAAVLTTTEGAASVKFQAFHVANQTDPISVKTAVATSIGAENAEEGTTYFPLFVVTDTGRGVSNKKFSISADYNTSKSTDYMNYMFKVIENGYILESIGFCLDPEQTASNQNVSLEAMINRNSKQVIVKQFDEEIKAFYTALATALDTTTDTLYGGDVLFNKNKKGTAALSTDYTIDATSVALSTNIGLSLEDGDNGAFGTTPLATANATAYSTAMTKAFNGQLSNEIYDLDKYKIDLIVDANYPADVKRAIEALVTYREDCMFFRDLGLGLNTLAAVTAANETSGMLKNKFIATYCTTYDVVDPYSHKQITVTAGYSLTKILAKHFSDGRNRAICGMVNGAVIKDAIMGTENFIPVITPTVNEKEALVDDRINYAGYYDNDLVLETCYTSQDKLSEFSFANNILAIQEVLKAVRSYCPSIRYGFITGEDLRKYKDDVQSVLDRYSNSFMSLNLEYIEDAVYTANRIFYAAIKVQFKQFVQTEYFKVIALPS